MCEHTYLHCTLASTYYSDCVHAQPTFNNTTAFTSAHRTRRQLNRRAAFSERLQGTVAIAKLLKPS